MKKVRSQAGAGSPGPARAAAEPSLVSATPGVGSYSVPAGFFIGLAILAYLGHAELGYNNGLFSEGVYEPYADLKSIPRAGGEVNPVDAGREVYTQMCQACHQPNGSGNPANGCPPLAQSDWVLEEGPARVIRLVLNGAKGPITVNGKEWGSDAGMLAFKDALTDDQIAYVLTYVRQSPEWKNNAPAVTPEMVKAVREKIANRPNPWTAAELLKVPTTE